MYGRELQDEVLKSHERLNTYASDTIAHYEHFMDHMLPYIVGEHSKIEIDAKENNERHVIHLRNVTYKRPVVDETTMISKNLKSGNDDDLFPDEARTRALSYCARVLVDMEHIVYEKIDGVDKVKGVPIVYREMTLLELPAMIRSKYCHSSIDPSKECWMDYGGYFIIRGNAKVLQPQKSQRINVHLVRGEKHGTIDSEIRSLRADEKFRSTSTLYMQLSGGPPEITVSVPFIKLRVPLICILKILDVHTQDDIDEIMWKHADDPYGAGKRIFSSVYSHNLAKASMEEILNYMSSGLSNFEADSEKMRKQVLNQVHGELLPHVGYDDSPLTKSKKLLYLSIIVRRMINVYLGREKGDDRDFEGYKSVQMSAGVLSVMFRQQFAASMKLLRARLYDRCKKSKHLDISSLMSDSLSRDIMKAFSEGEVTVSKDSSNAGMSVIQIAQQVNPLGLQTHIQRVSTPLPRDGKYTQLRGVDPTQLFVFCPTETPEGHGCGLLQNLATFAHVRVGVPLKDLEKAVLRISGITPLTSFRLPENTSLVFVNSDPIGYVYDSNEFIELARQARRTNYIPYNTSIVRSYFGLCISCDMGVVTFPLLHLATLRSQLSAAIEDASGGRDELWNAMKRRGIIEYVDAWELLEYRVAFKPEDVTDHTHLAPHPSGFLGTCASSVPFPDHDQAPRVAYQAGMVKQAISTPASNLADRMDIGYAYSLWYPQKPMADTAIARAKGMNDWPMGENLMIAIAPYGGLNQEDSIIRSRGSVDRGSGRVTVHKIIRAICRKRGSDQEYFEHPLWTDVGKPKCESIRGNSNYDKIGIDGLPEEGTPIKNGDVIIGRVLHIEDTDDEGNIKIKRKDRSVVLQCEPTENYIIEKVVLTTTKEGFRFVKLKIRTVRIPQEGDKISSRHGQKGTIGLLMAEEDLPYVMSGPNEGMRPDAIINLHCINGRMTIGKLLEILFSSLGLAKGQFVDASPFREVNAKWAIKELLKLGYGTEETMINGMTGEVMSKPWFIGSCFYHTLKHMVLDKITSRQRGQRAILTKQPLDGRANQGGQRMGEMEKDAFLAHGAAFALDDRSRIASDAHTAVVCSQCGNVGESRDETLRGMMSSSLEEQSGECLLCGNNSLVTLPTTYCYSGLLLRELATCGIKVVHTFEKEIHDEIKSLNL